MLTSITIWVVAAIAAAIVAGSKNRSAAGWFFLTVLLTPLMLLIVLVLPRAIGRDEAACPECHGIVKRAARRCRHCGYVAPTAPVLEGRFAVEPPTKREHPVDRFMRSG